MVYICADDYGLCESTSAHIQQCIDKGALNRVSIFPNIDKVDLNEVLKVKKIRVSLHLNLVEGKCMADASEVYLLADENGDLKHTFSGLFKLNLFHKKKFEEQVYKEIRAQVLFWKSILPPDTYFCVDSHQHTHMIPGVFKGLIRVLKEEQIDVHHMRIPAEPLLPYIKTPSLYFSYSIVNLIKQWVLKFLWLINKGQLKGYTIPTSYFLGILLSGKMDEKRVTKLLKEYVKLGKKNGRNIEVLFHPGFSEETDPGFENKNIAFKKFYSSENRKTEFDSVIKLSERGVF